MRRIATLVATGAVAAATAITLVASPASADTSVNVLKSTMGGSSADGFSAPKTGSWTSRGLKSVSGAGTYSRSKTGTLISGHIRDSRTGSYYGGLYFRVVANDNKHYEYVIVNVTRHKTTQSFKLPKSKYSNHLQIAEVLVQKTKSGWKLYKPSKGYKFYTVF
jgi:hypothetical protein